MLNNYETYFFFSILGINAQEQIYKNIFFFFADFVHTFFEFLFMPPGRGGARTFIYANDKYMVYVLIILLLILIILLLLLRTKTTHHANNFLIKI